MIVRDENRSTDDDVLSIVAEQTALTVQLLVASIHVHNMFELKDKEDQILK